MMSYRWWIAGFGLLLAILILSVGKGNTRKTTDVDTYKYLCSSACLVWRRNL